VKMRLSPHSSAWRLGIAARPLIGLLVLGILLAGCAAQNGDNTPISGHLIATGSTALQPLITQAAKSYMQLHAGVTIVVNGGGSYAGLDAVTSTDPTKRADIGDSDVYADPAIYPDPNLTDNLVCVIPFAMVVNPTVNVTTIKRTDIIDIFATGKITDWSQLGAPSQKIVPIVRTAKSGTRATFRRYLLGGLDESANLTTIDSSQDVLKAVANTPGAIAYLALSVVDATVRQLQIDGVDATPANVIAGHYPFWSFEHMYTLGDDGNRPLIDFIHYMTSNNVQNVAQGLKYIPIAAMQLQTASTTSFVYPNTAPIALKREDDLG